MGHLPDVVSDKFPLTKDEIIKEVVRSVRMT